MQNKRAPGWPDSRSFIRYQELTGCDFRSTTLRKVWIDLGCGRGTALSEWVISTPQAIAVGIDSAMPASQPVGVHFRQGDFPRDLTTIKDFVGYSEFVTDIYGPCTYSSQPIECLVHLSSLLGVKGRGFVVTHSARFGSGSATLAFLREYFNGEGIPFEWTRFATRSDSTGAPIEMLRFCIGSPKSKLPQAELIARLNSRIGRPRKKQIVWKSINGTARIWEIAFSKS